MKVAVVGSRGITNKKIIFNILEKYNITCVVSGGAIGVDRIGEDYANSINIQTEIYLPDWEKFGKSAGFKRNKDIMNSEITIAFWDGKSNGTLDSINYSKKLKHPTFVWIISENVVINNDIKGPF